MCEQCLIEKINHIFSINCTFCNLKGGYGGPPPENFKNQESRRSHLWSFCRTILPSVNERFQRISHYCMLFLNIKFRQICISSVLVLGCRLHCLDLTNLDNDIRKSGIYSEVK